MTGRSSCPECGTILRIRDRTFVGRRVNCPECKTALRIEAANEDGSYVTRRLAKSELVHPAHPVPTNAAKPNRVTLAGRIQAVVKKWVNSPLTAAWLLAVAVMALIAVLTLTPKVRHAPNRSGPAPVVAPPPTESKTAPELAIENNAAPQTKPDETSPVRPPVDATITISALEPANVNEPLPWPPVSIVTNPDPEPRRPTKVDVEKKMALPFPEYKQPKPISRRELIESLREQLGAPIYYDNDDLGDAALNSSVTFDLQKTTIGGVIKTVADGANWDMLVEDTGLRLTKRRSTQ